MANRPETGSEMTRLTARAVEWGSARGQVRVQVRGPALALALAAVPAGWRS